MSRPPYFYRELNLSEGIISPSTVHVQNTVVAGYFRKYLLQRVLSVFKVTAPEDWPTNYWLYSIFGSGICAVIRTTQYGVIPQWCTLSGYDVFYRPRSVMISNPLINNGDSMQLVIDEECALVYCQPDYSGMMDIVSYYANLMALATESVSVNLLNSRLAYMFAASNKQSAESLKKLYDRVASGEPAVVYDKSLSTESGETPVQLFTQDLTSNFITPKVLESLRTIQQMFDTEIGIPNANLSKRERQITDEVNANNVETQSRMAMCLDTLKKCCKRASQMYGITLDFDWRYRQQEVDHADTNVGPNGPAQLG